MNFLGADMRTALHHMPVHARICKQWLLALPVSEGGVTVVGKKHFSLIQMLIFKSKWVYVLFLQLNRIIKKPIALTTTRRAPF